MTALLAYLIRVFLASQRYAPPLVVLVFVVGAVITSPPLDASSALLLAVGQFACSMWAAYLAAGMEGLAQEAVTATRVGSRTRPWTAKLLIAAILVLVLPALAVSCAAASRHLSTGTGAVGVAAVLAPTMAGIGVGSLVHGMCPNRPGQATLAILTLTVFDAAAPWAPPLGSLGRAHGGSGDVGALAVTVLGSALIGLSALVVSHRLDLRR